MKPQDQNPAIILPLHLWHLCHLWIQLWHLWMVAEIGHAT